MTTGDVSEAIGSAFGWEPSGPRPAVTEADQSVARAFGQEVPALSEAPKLKPEDEMMALLEEFRELRVSRRGDSREVASNAAVVQRVLMSEWAMEGRRVTHRVTKPERLAELRETVKALRAEVPLSGAQESAAPAGDVTRADVDASVARAFGRAPVTGR